MDSILKKRLIIIAGSALLIAALFFLLRGPYLSNAVKRIIIPVLEDATNERIIIDNAVVNLFPFYIQAKGLKMFDKDGNKLLWISKARAYLDLTGLLSDELKIRKLTVKEPELTADEVFLKSITQRMNATASGEGGRKRKISFRNVELTNGNFSVKYLNGLRLSGKGLFFEMNTKDYIDAQVKLNKLNVKTPGNTEMSGGFDGRMKMTDEKIEFPEINIHSSKTGVRGEGVVRLSSEGEVRDGSFSGSAKIYEDIIQKISGLKMDKESMLSFDGTVKMTMDDISKKPKFTVDLKTESWFYLETLMALLKIKENVTGKVAVKGKISGTFPELAGSGTGRLEDGVLHSVHLDDAEGEVTYKDMKFSLANFTSRTYNGEMKGNASISLPHGNYEVDADVSGIDSPDFLRIIRWEPPFPHGKVSGHYQLKHEHGKDLEVTANINYLNTPEENGNVLNRLRTIKTGLRLKEGLLELRNSVLSTTVSSLALDGIIDFRKRVMDIELLLDSRDVADLVLPYYSGLAAPGKFKGRATGPINDPEISGRFDAASGSVHGMGFTGASADLTYRISSLSVKRLNIIDGASSYDASGSIEFRNAKGLFDFNEPYYRAKAVVKDGNLKAFVTSLYKDIPVSGVVNGTILFDGASKDFTVKGDLIAKDSSAYGQQFEKITVKTTLRPANMEFHSVTALKGASALEAKGNLFFDERFNFTAVSSKLNLADINMLQRLSIGGSASLEVNGSGTFEDHDIKFSSDIFESAFRGRQAGKGRVEGRIKDRSYSAQGNFMNGSLTARAGGSFSKKPLWDAEIDIRRGNYDFLISGFMKNIPEDLSLFIEGKINIKGEGEKISLLSRLGYLNCNLYGYNLRNSNDIVLELANRELVIRAFSLTGDSVKLSAEGSLKLNEQYNVKIRGNMDFVPFRTLSEKFASLKGQGDFVVDIAGAWDTPDVNGEISVNDAQVFFREYPYKIGPLNGRVFLKKDRFTFDALKTAFGGGHIVLSGVGYLKGLSIKRIFISSLIEGVNIKPYEKVSATMDGKLFYETSEKGSAVSGDVDIKKARYEKAVDWNKWLVGLKELNKETIRYPVFFRDTEFNVHVSGTENIIIDNNIAKTPVQIDLTLTGNVSRYGLIGRVEADEGSIYFRSNEFKILEGSNVDFISSSRIVPVFHILAETYAGDYYIKLNLDGTMDKFSLSLFSDPPLSEMEILSLLTVGQTGKESRGFESGIATNEAASVLTGGLQELMQESIKGITGIERFMIEPHTTSAGAVSPKVTIGKRLLEDKLFVTYSTSVGTTEESVIRLEYKVSNNLSLVGSRDEIGSVGGDVKFRFEFK